MNEPSQNIVLTGFMGTGKSTVGQIVAARLNRPFVDMDSVIEQRTSRTIADIFAAEGESEFRRLERELCAELSRQQYLVIATGGGALVDPVNRKLMVGSGMVICLTAPVEVLAARLQDDTARPLIADDPATKLAALLEARTQAYAALPFHIDTESLAPEQVAEAILDLWHKHFM